MASIKIKFRPSSVRGKEGVLFLQIIHRRVVRQIVTPYRLHAHEWDAFSQQVLLDAPSTQDPRWIHLARIDTMIQSEYRLLCRIVTSFDQTSANYSADSVVNEYHRLDVALIQSYEAWLKHRGICRNTISFYMRILRAVYNRAVANGVVAQQYPFRPTYTGIDKTRKRAVDFSVIKTIKEADLSAHPSLELARDLFLMSFYLRGASFIDLAHLRKSDLREGFLCYTRSKTGQKMKVKWEPLMQEIVEKYQAQTAFSPFLLPILSGGRLYNKEYHNAQARISYHLRKIARAIGLPCPLTLYVARHSWATIARDRQIPLSVISEALGHDSEQTTRIYLQSISSPEVDKANASILSSF
uniref:site-specific integrase n=1 Tax=Prevotella sp. TaxID=59823 RepID=UPI0040284A90